MKVKIGMHAEPSQEVSIACQETTGHSRVTKM